MKAKVLKTKLYSLIFILSSTFLFAANVNMPSTTPEERGYLVKYYKVWKETDNRSDEFSSEIKPSDITKSLHFRVIRDKKNKIITISFYYRRLKIAPHVNDDGIWFNYIKYEYDRQGNPAKKTFYRQTGEPQGRYTFEYQNRRLVRINAQDYVLNPSREHEYKLKYFTIFDYYPNGKTKVMARFDMSQNPEEKFFYDNSGKLIKYERFFPNSNIVQYFINFKYDAQNRVSQQRIYNIDGVMVEVPGTEEPRTYQDLLRSRYPESGRRSLEDRTENNNPSPPRSNTAPQGNRTTPSTSMRNNNASPGTLREPESTYR
jgi:hypothetical protein